MMVAKVLNESKDDSARGHLKEGGVQSCELTNRYGGQEPVSGEFATICVQRKGRQRDEALGSVDRVNDLVV